MGTGQKIVTTVLWGLAVLGMLAMVGTGLWTHRGHDVRPLADLSGAALASVPPSEGELPAYFPAPAFALTDQNGNTVTDQSLRGNVWVAMVFFTECPGICPGMIGRLVAIQEAVPDPAVKLVPFSVDPEHDTPYVLKQYADRIQADPQRWHFLTGTTEQMLQAADGLKLAVEPAQGDRPIIHSGKLLLVDRSGQVRGVYDHQDDEAMNRLATDAMRLVRGK